ncbi:chorismate mutase [Tropicimonas sp. S265A]|uniref:chorismate mutase n=1 Tax=Tropicimonas sp. S265A TaxID=3415134 RepID=UPI003C7DAF5F
MKDTSPNSPDRCATMEDLRRGIDRLDADLIQMLATRARFIDRAVQIKAEAGLPANIPSRVEEVVAKVRAAADRERLSPDLAEDLWRTLIAWSIAREEQTLGASDPAQPPQETTR